MGGLGDFLHMVAGAISCGTPLLRGRLVGLAVAKVRGASFAFLTSDRTALTPALKQIEGKREGGASKVGHRKPNKTPAQERRSARDSARYHMKKVAKAAHPQ